MCVLPGLSICLPPHTNVAPSFTPVSQYSTSLSRWALWFCGPWSVDRSRGSPIFIFLISSTLEGEGRLKKRKLHRFSCLCALAANRVCSCGSKHHIPLKSFLTSWTCQGFCLLTTRLMNSSCIDSSTNRRPAAIQFSPLLKYTELMPWRTTSTKKRELRHRINTIFDLHRSLSPVTMMSASLPVCILSVFY